MQVPCMVTQQDQDQNKKTSPKKMKEEKQQQCKYPKEKPESIHSGAILQRAE